MKNKSIILLYLFLSQIALGQNINISNGNVFDGEPYIAINPNDFQHMVVAWMGWVNLSNRFKIKTKTSFDGGTTWSSTYELPHTVVGYSSADPCVDFNNLGEVFISYIDFTGTTPPITGGVYLCKSSDGGLTWDNPKEVVNTSHDDSQWPIDRPWMVIDKSNTSNQGNIYITTFNLNRLSPPYNPYLSISNDNGDSFSTRYADTTDWLAGSINPFPVCSPTVSNAGVLYASYPSYVLTQSLYNQSFIAISSDGGTSLSHKKIRTFIPPTNIADYPLAKKSALLISNPADAKHLAYIYLSAETGDLDVYLIESFDEGDNWSTPLRLNDDPLMNNRMQDMIWADFDVDGDLVVSWRDRRNGTNETYQSATEIWATFRHKDSLNFAPNFQITNQQIDHDTDLEEAGNDFMCIKLRNNTLSATWGDTRDGELNIWFQQMNIDGTILSFNQISNEKIPNVKIYPNPTNSILNIETESISEIKIYDSKGVTILHETYSIKSSAVNLTMPKLNIGIYLIEVITDSMKYSDKIIVH